MNLKRKKGYLGYKMAASLLLKTRTTKAQLSKITLSSNPPKKRECVMELSEMASLSKSRWQKRNPKRDEIANRPVSE